MASVATNITTINTQAAVLDGLVTSFLAAKALIAAAETEIRQAQPNVNHHARAGRIRLAEYALAKMDNPNLNGGQTVAALASSAWTGVPDMSAPLMTVPQVEAQISDRRECLALLDQKRGTWLCPLYPATRPQQRHLLPGVFYWTIARTSVDEKGHPLRRAPTIQRSVPDIEVVPRWREHIKVV